MLHERIHGPVLDSHLYAAERGAGRNADLNFILSVYLRRVEPDSSGLYPDENGGLTQIQRWEDAEWEEFRHGFYNWVHGFFRGRFWLVPPAGYSGLDWPDVNPTHRPNVKCGLTLWVHARPEHARISINCVHAVPGQSMRSNTNRVGHFAELEADDNAYEELSPFAGLPETQPHVTVLHEVGHLLGLDHVSRHAAACSVEGAVGCYGTTQWQRGDLMGWGTRVEKWHAWPWRDRIRYHTGVGGWTVVLERPVPRPLAASGFDAGIGPRLPGGLRDAGV